MDTQVLNGLRYECMRADRHRKNLPYVPKNTFMPIYKQYNLNLNLED